MRMFLLSLDEIAYVKKKNNIEGNTGLETATGVTRKTWHTALKFRRPTPQVLDALAMLGARPSKILVADEPLALAPTAA